mmetsp:Transcript_17392/g.47975  ORF Transcript_17392/g.47975 Transcript_17392/m.47975 type:complete len:292 (-) Transcript_17392:869-1744(-)
MCTILLAIQIVGSSVANPYPTGCSLSPCYHGCRYLWFSLPQLEVVVPEVGPRRSGPRLADVGRRSVAGEPAPATAIPVQLFPARLPPQARGLFSEAPGRRGTPGLCPPRAGAFQRPAGLRSGLVPSRHSGPTVAAAVGVLEIFIIIIGGRTRVRRRGVNVLSVVPPAGLGPAGLALWPFVVLVVVGIAAAVVIATGTVVVRVNAALASLPAIAAGLWIAVPFLEALVLFLEIGDPAGLGLPLPPQLVGLPAGNGQLLLDAHHLVLHDGQPAGAFLTVLEQVLELAGRNLAG